MVYKQNNTRLTHAALWLLALHTFGLIDGRVLLPTWSQNLPLTRANQQQLYTTA